MLDLDFFKSVNDTYGHQAGDAVLREIAQCLRANLHHGVTICRYGGEEFAVLIGLSPQEEILEIAERMRQAVASLRIRVNERNQINITASFGVAHYLPDAPTAEELIRRADIALYRAKEAGRNCVREWNEQPPALRLAPAF
jgi:two-component system cell cycle response regulator